MSIEGRIHITLSPNKDGLAANIRSERPVLASRILEGKPINEALSMVPMIFSLCGQAQSVAAVRAAESGLDMEAGSNIENGREILIRLEALREHLWRIFIDWPELLGEAPRTRSFAKINQSASALQKMLDIEGSLTRQPGHQHWEVDEATQSAWQSLHSLVGGLMFDPSNDEGQVFPFFLLDKLVEHDWAKLGAVSSPALPALDNVELAEQLRGENADAYVVQPECNGRHFETGPFARQRSHTALARARETFGDGVYARFAARVLEVTQLLDELSRLFDGEALPVNKGDAGVAQVQAIRGLLAHCIDTDGEIITRYRILAPTEWNFHPEGVVQKMLSKLPGKSEDDLRQQARLIVQAVDPCVGYDIHVNSEAGQA